MLPFVKNSFCNLWQSELACTMVKAAAEKKKEKRRNKKGLNFSGWFGAGHSRCAPPVPSTLGHSRDQAESLSDPGGDPTTFRSPSVEPFETRPFDPVVQPGSGDERMEFLEFMYRTFCRRARFLASVELWNGASVMFLNTVAAAGYSVMPTT